MGSLCLEKKKFDSKEELINNRIDMKGQYNNFKEYSNFTVNVLKKRTISLNEYEIGGILIDKKGKSHFTGRISKQLILIETKSLVNLKEGELVFEGAFDTNKNKYLGEFRLKTSTKSYGSFWTEVLEDYFWTDSYANEPPITSKSLPSDYTRTRDSNARFSSMNI